MGRRNQKVVSRKPCFFKVLLGDFDKKLRIPPAFVKHVAMERSHEAVLEGPSGDKWFVKLCQGRSNCTYLHDDWDIFVKDHSLQELDVLLFKYDGNLCFKVLIFDRTACEREDVLAVRSSQKHSFGKSAEKQSALNGIVVGRNHKYQQLSGKNASYICEPPPVKRAHAINGQEIVDLPPCKGCVCPTGTLVSAVQKELWARVCSFRSRFPFFSSFIRKSYIQERSYLALPKRVRVHLPQGHVMLSLQNSQGESWKVKYLYYPRRSILSAGWLAFSRSNNLRAGDICIFEMVHNQEWKVHIFRLQEQDTL